MGSYDIMQVCRRWGHQITAIYNRGSQHRQEFCDHCGSKTTYECDSCNTPIRGYYWVEGVIGGISPGVPLNCHKCGSGYPWRTRLLWKRFVLSLVAPFKYLVDAIISIFKK